ncbi:Polyketide cyclase / dehydrase and lipid transport [Caballeronia catudaia]|uniref:Polyketide cyclase / dehydrase and lipid transport n=1 Tax=Caballeronia catudaia TaxID=1777136 RepID=A0A158DQ97_9BURK|nr:SRPBCC family protein [Caballeronia catudaia]SAK96590.1 Polyketide cyclase / dehydrase and lipid transport [Caballeronia catudaia]
MRTRARYVLAILAAVLAIVAVLFIPLPRGVLPDTRIVSVAAIQRAPTDVFDFVTTPAHWPQWHPSSLSVQGKTGHPLDVGEQVVEEFLVAGRRGRVVWTVSVKTFPARWSIDGVMDGRPAGTVTYTLTPEANGTRFVREFSYRASSLWFAFVNWIVLKGAIQSESDEAVTRLKRLLQSGAAP